MARIGTFPSDTGIPPPPGQYQGGSNPGAGQRPQHQSHSNGPSPHPLSAPAASESFDFTASPPLASLRTSWGGQQGRGGGTRSLTPSATSSPNLTRLGSPWLSSRMATRMARVSSPNGLTALGEGGSLPLLPGHQRRVDEGAAVAAAAVTMTSEPFAFPPGEVARALPPA